MWQPSLLGSESTGSLGDLHAGGQMLGGGRLASPQLGTPGTCLGSDE